jgi:hypothetical protein
MAASWENDPALLGVLPGTTGNLDPTSTSAPAGITGAVTGTGTGQHGIIPLVGSFGGGGMLGGLDHLWHWLNKPFNAPMSPVDIFLVVGSVLIAIILWNLILMHLRMAAEAI